MFELPDISPELLHSNITKDLLLIFLIKKKNFCGKKKKKKTLAKKKKKIFFNPPQSTWDLNSPTKDQTHVPCIRRAVLTTGSPKKFL